MEGFKGVKHYILIIIYIIFFYIYSDHSYDLKYSSLLPIFSTVSTSTLHTITGNMLGDGSISLSKVNKGEGKYSMTMKVNSLNYLHHLNEDIYSQFTNTKFYAYPNNLLPQHKGKEITQYHFRTKTNPLFTALHDLCYERDNGKNKFVKIVPLNISDMFS